MNEREQTPAGRRRPGRGRRAAAGVAALLLLTGSPYAIAHEIPDDVLLRILVTPRDGALEILVRAPLEAMRDFDWPLRGPGYLDLEKSRPLLDDAAVLWLAQGLRFESDGELLPMPELRGVRLSLPTDRSFGSPESARAHLAASSLAANIPLVPAQALLDARFEIPVDDPGAPLTIVPELARLGIRTTTLLLFRTPDGADRLYRYTGDPGRLHLDPGWLHAASRFVILGFGHILEGIDHLLFLACLVLPYRRLRPLVPIVTAFTVAHSITLLAAVLGLAPRALWFPPLVEALIAASIVFMAIENALGARLGRRWLIAFAFGLVHGFGFSFALGESLQFGGSWLLTSLLSFNVGVELGQLTVLAVMLPAWRLVHRKIESRVATILASVLIGHTAWHWMTGRANALAAYRLEWPALDLLWLAAGLRWAMLVLIAAAAAWALHEIFDRWENRRPEPPPRASGSVAES